jgi:hypothetical protein
MPLHVVALRQYRAAPHEGKDGRLLQQLPPGLAQIYQTRGPITACLRDAQGHLLACTRAVA